MGDSTQWWNYVQRRLDQLDWNTTAFERASGINRSRLVAWRNGAAVSVENARAVAAAFSDPILSVLVAAGILTPAEAGQPAEPILDAASLSAEELANEVRRRLLETHAPTASEVVADSHRYTSRRKSPKASQGRQTGP
ncbi:hypothetical protein JOF56_011664 [Kibdelosporangium banguiense]|uniref:XRE family transcriptional regulator n=1 Tax=Kibdelosporangium banguiense TaxID=1365924 RepID=A0ABS4U3P1_9PSEU|nr:XRE family transcriptional regulator [Kibdelosporangium banguiense]MBP2331279.1 hypothetical protein [Kibdelosporangium banguiense]